MKVKASERVALVIATGLWMGLAGLGLASSAQAAPASGTAASEKPAAAKPHVAKKLAKPVVAKTNRVAAVAKPKSGDGKPIVEPAALANTTEADAQASLPDAVANANAQMPVVDAAAAGQAAAPAEQTAGSQLVASDQLNDLDLAASAEAAPQQTVGRSTSALVTAMAHDDTLWSQTSLIGKIFIAFGGLLTAASAARMFIV